MIQNEEQLQQTREALGHLEEGLASLKRDILPHSTRRFALMAESAVDHIRRLRDEIDEYIGLRCAVSEQAEFWMRLEGPEIDIGDAPTSVVTEMLDVVRVGVESVAGSLETTLGRSRPSAKLKQACDLRIVAWLPGSLQVGLRLPFLEPLPSELGAQAHTALKLYLKAAQWAGSDEGMADLEDDFPDREQRRLLIKQVSKLLPRRKGNVHLVELSGREVPHGPIRLRPETRKRVSLAIRETVEDYTIRAEGILRKIDLDRRRFIIRDPSGAIETRCSVDPERDDLLETAKHAIDHRIVVTGRQKGKATRRSRSVQVTQIEVLGAPVGA